MQLTIYNHATGNIYSFSLSQDSIDEFEGKPEEDLKRSPAILKEMKELEINPHDAEVRLVNRSYCVHSTL